jgi:signal transduction histidine kinase
MGEREEIPGGTLRVDSKPGASTRVKARVPLDGRKV